MTLLLELRQVTHYYSKQRALHGVSLTDESGAIGLIGQNGAGKSTLMQILLGLITPTTGYAAVLQRGIFSEG